MNSVDDSIVGVFMGFILGLFLVGMVGIVTSSIENHCYDLGSLMEKKTMVIDNKCTVQMDNNLWVPVNELSLVQKTK